MTETAATLKTEASPDFAAPTAVASGGWPAIRPSAATRATPAATASTQPIPRAAARRAHQASKGDWKPGSFFGRPYFGDPPKYFLPGVIAAKLPIGLTLLGIILFVGRRMPSEFRVPLLFVSVVLAGFFWCSPSAQRTVAFATLSRCGVTRFSEDSPRTLQVTSRSKAIQVVTLLAYVISGVSAVAQLRPYEYYNELIGGSKNGYFNFNDEGVSMESLRGKELVKYYREVVRPAGEIPYLFYYMPKPQRKRLGMDWVGNDMSRDAVRLQSRELTGVISYETRFLGKRPFWGYAATPSRNSGRQVRQFGRISRDV